jgi:hypothetical protein
MIPQEHNHSEGWHLTVLVLASLQQAQRSAKLQYANPCFQVAANWLNSLQASCPSGTYPVPSCCCCCGAAVLLHCTALYCTALCRLHSQLSGWLSESIKANWSQAAAAAALRCSHLSGCELNASPGPSHHASKSPGMLLIKSPGRRPTQRSVFCNRQQQQHQE